MGFRAPDETERINIATPVASILVRHFPMGTLSTSWADALTAVGATTEYAGNGPVLWPLQPSMEIPEGINSDAA